MSSRLQRIQQNPAVVTGITIHSSLTVVLIIRDGGVSLDFVIYDGFICRCCIDGSVIVRYR